MKGAQPKSSSMNAYKTHGLTTLKKAVRVLGGRAIDKRTKIGRALEQCRMDLVHDLGGFDGTSTMQRQIIDLAVKTKFILDTLDAWMVLQKSLVNHRKRVVYPAVLQRQQMADSLARYMTQLGLEKRSKTVATISEYLEEKAS